MTSRIATRMRSLMMAAHGALGDIPPVKFEAAHYAQLATTG